MGERTGKHYLAWIISYKANACQFVLSAYSAPFPDVIAVLGEWGSLHVVTGDGKVYKLFDV